MKVVLNKDHIFHSEIHNLYHFILTYEFFSYIILLILLLNLRMKSKIHYPVFRKKKQISIRISMLILFELSCKVVSS